MTPMTFVMALNAAIVRLKREGSVSSLMLVMCTTTNLHIILQFSSVASMMLLNLPTNLYLTFQVSSVASLMLPNYNGRIIDNIVEGDKAGEQERGYVWGGDFVRLR